MAIPRSVHKALPGAANLANLLPTGTFFAFQNIVPSLSNNGKCEAVANKYMTLVVTVLCSLACFFSSFTDSFIGQDGKLYYGIATPKGLYVFYDETDHDLEDDVDAKQTMLSKYRLNALDFVHACCSMTLFLVMACSSAYVQGCFFPEPGPNANALMKNLPLLGGGMASGLFLLFPTKRRGIGFADHVHTKEETQG